MDDELIVFYKAKILALWNVLGNETTDKVSAFILSKNIFVLKQCKFFEPVLDGVYLTIRRDLLR